MRLETLDRSDLSEARWTGAVLCRDVLGRGRRPLLLKGHRLQPGDASILAGADDQELHLLWPDPGEVDEDTAARRLAGVVAGPGVELHSPVESQVRLSAARRGLARVEAGTLARLNAIEGVTVFTVPDGLPVDRGKTLAGVKITPLVMEERTLAEAEKAATAGPPTLSVSAFLALRLAAVVRQRIDERARRKFEASLVARAAWFGGSVVSVEYAPSQTAAGAALRRAAAAADLALVVGVASVDPLESTWRDLLAAGASVVRRGLPTHPGSSYWVVSLGDVPVIGVASCGMLSKRSALDLLLTRCFAGGPLDQGFLAGLGHGGLLGPEAAWRIPAWGGDAAGE